MTFATTVYSFRRRWLSRAVSIIYIVTNHCDNQFLLHQHSSYWLIWSCTIYQKHAFYLLPNNFLKAFGKSGCNWQVHIYGYLTITLNVNLVQFILRRSILVQAFCNWITCNYVLQRMLGPERCCWKMLVCYLLIYWFDGQMNLLCSSLLCEHRISSIKDILTLKWPKPRKLHWKALQAKNFR